MLHRGIQDDVCSILLEQDIERKLRLAELLVARRHTLPAELDSGDKAPVVRPGRPGSFQVLPSEVVPRRPKLTTARGRYLLAHSVAHIELSAVELALMAVADFPDQSAAYYRDMLFIAEEEVRHARMMLRRLNQLGGALGTDPVHLELWEIASRYPDLVDRLAVVPRILEARGLDVSGNLKQRLRAGGDGETADCLEVIYRDEIGHVALGTKWFRRACEQRGEDPEDRFLLIAADYRPGRSAPLDHEGRRRAGFTERELAFMARESEN